MKIETTKNIAEKNALGGANWVFFVEQDYLCIK